MKKSRTSKDPFAEREAKNYAEPIPSREFILSVLAEAGVPVDHQTLCEKLGLQADAEVEALRRRLRAMGRDGQLISNRRGLYGLPDRMELAKGRVQGNRDGAGYFIPADGSGDLYLSPTEMQKAFDGDTVLARFVGIGSRGRREGMIVEILQRQFTQVVGRYYTDQGIGVLVAANRRIAQEILVPDNASHGASDGQFVVGEITTYPSPRHKPIAKIVEILGDTTTPGLEIDIAVRSYDLPFQWPTQVKREAARIDGAITEAELAGRQDLRQLPFVTIDGEDAKDFDDAVFARRAGGGWQLYVAIADVSHYVDVTSALDEEATKRGNSVYFPGHVIPMLPESLSNGVCSLKPDEDRLVMVCEMDIDASGEVTDYRFCEAVIHSHARLTYTEVAELLEPDDVEMGRRLQERMKKRHESLVDHLQTLYGLYLSLREARERGGALDFDTTETRIVFGEDRRIREIVPVVRTCAHRLIEECMLCANVAAAKLLQSSGLPVLYRVHEGPSREKLEALRDYLGELGLHLAGGDKPRPSDYQKLLLSIAERPDAHLLHTMVIRSMMQAVYQAENVGHFGLGFAVYTHFTSPIRRYPDLLVHRAIRFLLRGKKQNPHLLRPGGAPALSRPKIYPYDQNDMTSLGESCSATERRADAASYDVVDWLKCEYMQSRVGDEFDGTVATVTGFGLFVELDGIYIEGLVHITALDNDYYHFDAISHVLTGERTGRRYRMGDSVRVQVAAVSLDERKIDLVMVGAGRRPERPAREKKTTRTSANNSPDRSSGRGPGSGTEKKAAKRGKKGSKAGKKTAGRGAKNVASAGRKASGKSAKAKAGRRSSGPGAAGRKGGKAAGKAVRGGAGGKSGSRS
ncbi:MAG: ribonuclease R [Pseudomonadales bacterium]|nr:ribonuclease R [Pseudomonadales bacterium]